MSETQRYLTKKQMSVLAIGLMTLSRDDDSFFYAINNGVFEEDEIYNFVENIQKLVKEMNDDDLFYFKKVNRLDIPRGFDNFYN